MNGEIMREYQEFAKDKLGFEFNDINLLITALTYFPDAINVSPPDIKLFPSYFCSFASYG